MTLFTHMKFALTLCMCALTLSHTHLWAQTSKTTDTNTSETPMTKNPIVVMETTLGAFTIELFAQKAPATVTNFLQYVDDHFYDGTTFHRVVPGFVLQAGGLTHDFIKKPTRDPITNEASNGLKNMPWTLSMARTNNPESATSQFFINLVENRNLDKRAGSAGYAVFGKVTEGIPVLKKIEKEPRGIFRSHPESPNYPVIIEKAYRLKVAQNSSNETTPTKTGTPKQ